MVANLALRRQQDPFEQCKPRLFRHSSSMKGREVLKRQHNWQGIGLGLFVFCHFHDLHENRYQLRIDGTTKCAHFTFRALFSRLTFFIFSSKGHQQLTTTTKKGSKVILPFFIRKGQLSTLIHLLDNFSRQGWPNRPLLSCPKPLFQSEAKFEAVDSVFVKIGNGQINRLENLPWRRDK